MLARHSVRWVFAPFQGETEARGDAELDRAAEEEALREKPKACCIIDGHSETWWLLGSA